MIFLDIPRIWYTYHKMKDLRDVDGLPRHVGYIVDGNRRWAREHGLPSYEGHLAGYNVLYDIVLATFARGVSHASVYIFSTENWKRDSGEVEKLLKLGLKILKSDLPMFIEKEIKIRLLGTRDGLSDDLIKAIDCAEEGTKDFTEKTLAICFNYGGQREIADAVKKCIRDGLTEDQMDEEAIRSRLYAPDVPACDVIVRTGGDHRLSNFMLWRSSYSELIFLDKKWPDMCESDVDDILDIYSQRNRRFGS
jgi:undecaprenyl diphosphate synthase